MVRNFCRLGQWYFCHSTPLTNNSPRGVFPTTLAKSQTQALFRSHVHHWTNHRGEAWVTCWPFELVCETSLPWTIWKSERAVIPKGKLLPKEAESDTQKNKKTEQEPVTSKHRGEGTVVSLISVRGNRLNKVKWFAEKLMSVHGCASDSQTLDSEPLLDDKALIKWCIMLFHLSSWPTCPTSVYHREV